MVPASLLIAVGTTLCVSGLWFILRSLYFYYEMLYTDGRLKMCCRLNLEEWPVVENWNGSTVLVRIRRHVPTLHERLVFYARFKRACKAYKLEMRYRMPALTEVVAGAGLILIAMCP